MNEDISSSSMPSTSFKVFVYTSGQARGSENAYITNTLILPVFYVYNSRKHIIRFLFKGIFTEPLLEQGKHYFVAKLAKRFSKIKNYNSKIISKFGTVRMCISLQLDIGGVAVALSGRYSHWLSFVSIAV